MTDLMIDLETMANESNAAIVSIGATIFNIETGEKFSDFYERVDLQSCLDAGMIVNASTINWWLNQSNSARAEITKTNPSPLALALDKFFTWYKLDGAGKIKRIWGNSNRFDLGILLDGYSAVGRDAPWDFRDERDVRTLVEFAPEIKENEEFTGIPHHPVHDCHHQIKYCTKIWNKIHKGLDLLEQKD